MLYMSFDQQMNVQIMKHLYSDVLDKVFVLLFWRGRRGIATAGGSWVLLVNKKPLVLGFKC